MNIKIKDVLTLDDKNKYVVVSIVNLENKSYYYLVDINNNNVKFCYEYNDGLVEIDDNELIRKLLPLLYNSAKDNILSNLNNDL